MTREITYYLVRKITSALLYGNVEYFCVTAQGDYCTTDNPKHAMRWMSEEGATAMAHKLGWQWTVEEVTFQGDSMAG